MRCKQKKIAHCNYMTLMNLKMDTYRDDIHIGKETITKGFFLPTYTEEYYISVCYKDFENIYYLFNLDEALYWMNEIESMPSKLCVLQTLSEYCVRRKLKVRVG